MKHKHHDVRCYYTRIKEGDDDERDRRIKQPSGGGGDVRYEPSDLTSVASDRQRFESKFSRITTTYAVGGRRGCNVDEAFVRSAISATAAEAGESSGVVFSCRSIEGARIVAAAAAADGTAAASAASSSSRLCLLSSPCKSKKQITEARFDLGIQVMTVDSVSDVVRCSAVSHDIQLVLRICPLEEEQGFAAGDVRKRRCGEGAQRGAWFRILSEAKERGMAVVGVSVQSDQEEEGEEVATTRCEEESPLKTALRRAREASDLAWEQFGYRISILDIGAAMVAPEEAWRLGHACTAIAEEEEDGTADSSNREAIPSGAARSCLSSSSTIAATYFHRANALLDWYFPTSLFHEGLRILAEPARYVVPDDAVRVKWWGMPKVKRSAPSLHVYLGRSCAATEGASARRVGGGGARHQHSHVEHSMSGRPFAEVTAAAQA